MNISKKTLMVGRTFGAGRWQEVAGLATIQMNAAIWELKHLALVLQFGWCTM